MVGRRRSMLAVGAAMLGTCALASVALAGSDTTKLTTELDGGQEVPPADPDGEGRAKVRVDEETGQVCFKLRYEDIGIPNRGHIHNAAGGANGPIVVGFFDVAGPPPTPAADPVHDDLEDGRYEACVPVDDADLLRDIADNPENYYVNLHNTRFPGGCHPRSARRLTRPRVGPGPTGASDHHGLSEGDGVDVRWSG